MIEQDIIDGLIISAQYQLLHYPKYSIGQYIKNTIKLLLGHSNGKRNAFGWPNAMLANALVNVAKQDNDVREILVTYYKKYAKKKNKLPSIDCALNGYALLDLYEQEKNLEYEQMLNNIYHQISIYPSSADGNFPYNPKQPQDIYADGIGTVVPFLCRYGKTFSCKAAISMGLQQIDNFMKTGLDKKSGLPYHGFDATTKKKLGIIGWGRGVGWIMMGIVDSLPYIENQNDYDRLSEYLRVLIDNVVKYQLDTGYFTWQLPAIDGMVDTSATAMIGYGIAKAVELKVIDNSYSTVVQEAREAIKHSIDNNTIIDCSGECIGFGQYPQWNYGEYPWALAPGIQLLLLEQVTRKENR